MRSYAKLAVITAVAALGIALGGCASCSRGMKSWESNMSGGLERKVTLYSTTGEVIDAWEGKIDISESEEEVLFDLDG